MEEEKVTFDGSEIETEANIEKCPGCGANMVFSPEKQALECPYCGTVATIENSFGEEIRFANLLSSASTWADETHVFRCENCGARTVLDRTEIAKTCSFCGTTNIVETDELSGLKPNAVVPFRLTVQNAIERVKTWVKRKFFAPGKFKKSVTPENVSGLYTPAFTYDAQTHSTYSGVLGKYEYRTRRVNGKTVRERYTRYFHIGGSHELFFDDVLIQASSGISQGSIDKLQPFGTSDSKEYAKEYLSGFTASQYTKDGLACWEEAKTRMNGRIRSAILSRYVYDVVSSLNVDTNYSNVTYKYVLLPVYIGHCGWKNKIYNFFVNGYNGNVTGKTPVSVWKVLAVVLAGLAVVGGLFALVYFTGG
ncbi:MAG: hypothetical protein J6B79_07180 [Clostridia bacterium]|nr:hypothetical protein [Clostridia bacterium]